MVANIGKKKLVLLADMKPAPKQEETYTTPWGKVWTHGADVMSTWKRFGFKPPTEYRNDYLFKVNRDGGYVDGRK
jgi:hypothetical protein